MKDVYVLGLDAAATTFALQLKKHAVVHVVADAADDLRSFAGAATLPHDNADEQRDIEALLVPADSELVFHRARVVSAMGFVRDVHVRPARALDLSHARRVLVVGFSGWREWSAELVTKGLVAAGIAAEPLVVQRFGAAADASWHGMRARMTDVHFRGEIVDALKPALKDDALVLMPPLLGETSTGLPMQRALGNECGVDPGRFGEAIATAPSLFGEGHAERIARALGATAPRSDLGAVMKTADVHVFTTRAKAWLSERATHKVHDHTNSGAKTIGDKWAAGFRAAREVEAQWAR